MATRTKLLWVSGSNRPVKSAFVITNNELSFQFPESYDATRTLYVDPWVTAVTTLTNNNSAYDYGNPFPFDYSEPFVYYPTPVNIKGGWVVENVNINFVR